MTTTMELSKTEYEQVLEEGKSELKIEYKMDCNLSNLQDLLKAIKSDLKDYGVIVNYGVAKKPLDNSQSRVPFPNLVEILEITNDRSRQEILKAFITRHLKENELTDEWIYNTDIFKMNDLKVELLFHHSKETMGDDATINTLKEEPRESVAEQQDDDNRLYYRPLIPIVKPTDQEALRIAELLRSLVYLFDWNPEKKRELIQFIKDGKWWPSDWLLHIIQVNKRSYSDHAKMEKPTQKKHHYYNMERDSVRKMARDLRILIVSGVTGKLIFDDSEDVDYISGILRVRVELFDYWDLLFELIVIGHVEPYEIRLPAIMQQLKAAITTKQGYLTTYTPSTISEKNIAGANKLILKIDKVLKSMEDREMPCEIANFLLDPHTVGKTEKKQVYLIGGPQLGDELRSGLARAYQRGLLTWKKAREAILADAQDKEAKARANQEDKQNIIDQTEKLIKKREKEENEKSRGSVNQINQGNDDTDEDDDDDEGTDESDDGDDDEIP